MVEVEMVGADGSLIVANGEKHNFKRSRDIKCGDLNPNKMACKGNGTSVTSADGLQTEESSDSFPFFLQYSNSIFFLI